ncbi:amidase [Ramlibacter sp.]|uniref:amidase n=1 Tax=Ramlibacter sp. TaxID=1917967 RepID=UPI003D09D024
MTDLWKLTAREASALVKARKASPAELVRTALARIRETDAALNALPTLCAERALQRAAKPGLVETPLAGLPIAVKDMNDVEGVRTTYGSPLFADHVPPASDAMVETLEGNGALVLAKSNVPEFGHGANTYNEVFGKTRNPWDTSLTCGGSSGGSAVAVATGQVWAATGSDFGCSLRTPAAFCSVVGLRPSPGRIARSRTRLPYDNLWVQGPMARNVGDVAMLLDAMLGAHPLDPISMESPGHRYLDAALSPRTPRRIAFSADLGGAVQVSRQVRTLFAEAMKKIDDAGIACVEEAPDFTGAAGAYQALRANQFVGDLGPIIEAHSNKVRRELVENYARGKELPAEVLGKAENARGEIYERVARFMEAYDLLICPATAVLPFDVERRHVESIDGVAFQHYYEWYAICYVLTLTSLPVLSLPCGYSSEGLPVGIQVVGKPRGEYELIAFAARLEEVFGVSARTPCQPKVTHLGT